MAPDKKAEHADRKNRKDHRAIAKDRLAGKRRKNMRRRAHAGQDRDVNLRMAKEPEQVLPQKRGAAGVQRHERATHVQAARNKEARPRETIKKQEDSTPQQNRERDH